MSNEQVNALVAENKQLKAEVYDLSKSNQELSNAIQQAMQSTAMAAGIDVSEGVAFKDILKVITEQAQDSRDFKAGYISTEAAAGIKGD